MNPAVAAVKPSLIRLINREKKSTDIDLGLGQPMEPINPHWIDEAARRLKETGCPYTPNAGLESVRRRVAAHRLGSEAAFGRVLLSHGSQEGVYLTIKTLLDPAKDKVLIPLPAYGAYKKLCQMEGVGVVEVSHDPAHDFEPRADDILKALTDDIRLILLTTPNNPSGRVWRRAEAEKLVAALQARRGPPVWLLVDEVYRELVHIDDGAFFDDIYDHTVNIGGLSKSHSLTGLRIGWVLAPEDVIPPLTLVHQQVTTSASIHSQFMTEAVMTDRESFLACRRLWKGKAEAVQGIINRSPLHFAPLEGAFYAWMRLPDARFGSSTESCLALLNAHGVVTIPGAAFGPHYEGWIRLSYAGDVEDFRRGLSKIEQAYALKNG